ncbi:hypothetical protein, partial [Pseudomonas viridiflava]|uniref:hypothetical protein n=1 Tax=Pseudomonas viridiflava TaxID=33069 RepID=UPI00197D7EE2
MNDDAVSLKYRVDCIAGKPPPTKEIASLKWLAGCLTRDIRPLDQGPSRFGHSDQRVLAHLAT